MIQVIALSSAGMLFMLSAITGLVVAMRDYGAIVSMAIGTASLFGMAGGALMLMVVLTGGVA